MDGVVRRPAAVRVQPSPGLGSRVGGRGVVVASCKHPRARGIVRPNHPAQTLAAVTAEVQVEGRGEGAAMAVKRSPHAKAGDLVDPGDGPKRPRDDYRAYCE